jgi:hypothetical protein
MFLNIPQPSEIRRPPPNTTPFLQLKKPRDSFHCLHCPLLTTSMSTFNHVRHTSVHPSLKPAWNKTKLQSFQSSGHGVWYFEVRDASGPGCNVSEVSTSAIAGPATPSTDGASDSRPDSDLSFYGTADPNTILSPIAERSDSRPASELPPNGTLDPNNITSPTAEKPRDKGPAFELPFNGKLDPVTNIITYHPSKAEFFGGGFVEKMVDVADRMNGHAGAVLVDVPPDW